MSVYAHTDRYLCTRISSCAEIKGRQVSLPSEHQNFEYIFIMRNKGLISIQAFQGINRNL